MCNGVRIVENENGSFKRTSCLRRFSRFLFSSHSKRMAGPLQKHYTQLDCRCQYICTYNSVGYDLFLCIFRKHHPCSAVDSRCVDQDRERGYERDSHGSSRRFRIVVTREGPHGPSYFFDGGVSNYSSNMGNAYSLGQRTGKVADGQNLRKTESSSVGQ